MSRIPCRAFLLPLCAGLMVACGSISKDSSEPVEGTQDSPDGPTFLIGLVALVNPEQKFVLIQTESAPTMPVGHTLNALDATGSTSELIITPEKKGTYITADIKSGNPRIGNLVMYRPGKQGTTPPPPPTQPAAATNPNNPVPPPLNEFGQPGDLTLPSAPPSSAAKELPPLQGTPSDAPPVPVELPPAIE